MTPILDRIRAQGGDVIRDRWSMKLRRGRLSTDAVAWIKGKRVDLMRELWPAYDAWDERAAIREFEGEQPRRDAEEAAYAEVTAS